MMNQVRFLVQSNNFTKIKKIQFCKTHEKNLDTLYGIVKESIKRNRKSDFDQLMMIFSYHIVKEIRKNGVLEIIQEKVLRELSKNQSIKQVLKDNMLLKITFPHTCPVHINIILVLCFSVIWNLLALTPVGKYRTLLFSSDINLTKGLLAATHPMALFAIFLVILSALYSPKTNLLSSFN